MDTLAPAPLPERRRLITPLRVVLVLLLIPALVLIGRRVVPRYTDSDAAAAEQRLREVAWQVFVEAGDLARTDNGRVYTIDVAQLALYAALAGDRQLYEPLRAFILEHLLIDRGPGDTATGMVAWGYQPDTPPDASGTTEALRVAEALWRGSQAFDDLDDRAAVASIIDAYARHATTESGVWMIRNYYNLGTEAFITNSFLIDYDPDLLQALADDFGREDWAALAEQSASLVEACRTDAGLLHQIIRPEVGTIMPHLAPHGLYSINGIEQLSNVLATAERIVHTRPDIARGVLDFCRPRLDHLRLYYRADSGRRLYGEDDTWAGVETWAPLLRLATRLDDRRTHDHALPMVIGLSSNIAVEARPDRLFQLGEALLALQCSTRYTSTPATQEADRP